MRKSCGLAWRALAGGLVALLAFGAGTPGAKNVIGTFFEKLEKKGFPLAGRAFRDGMAEVDVYAEGKVTRYSFDKKGKVTSAPCPISYNPISIKASRFSAADAAAAVPAKAYKKEAEIRAVLFEGSGPRGEYLVATYDKNGKFVGVHRYESADGRWQGWEDAIGEKDPIERKPPKPPGG